MTVTFALWRFSSPHHSAACPKCDLRELGHPEVPLSVPRSTTFSPINVEPNRQQDERRSHGPPDIPGRSDSDGVGVAAGDRALAQSFPSNVIRIVVPNSASTPPDILAHIIATALAESEGWNVIVEDKPGAVMTIGVTEVLKQPADGYTLLSITAPFAAVPALVPDAKFTIESDVTPLVQMGTAYNVLVVNPSSRSIRRGLIAYLKEDPGKCTFSSGGLARPRTCRRAVQARTGVQATHVPYVQFPQAIGNLLSGSTPTSSSPFCRSCSTSTRASCARWR